jgi:Tol biopolymer transport system component
MLEIYFERDGDMWRSTRTSVSFQWGPPQLVSELSSIAWDGMAGISSDGLTIFVSSDRVQAGAQGLSDIYEATRATRADPWGTPTPVTQLSSPDPESCPYPAPDLLTIAFISSRSPSPGLDSIFQATRSTTATPWQTPTLIPGVNSTASDQCPWFNPGFTVLYFASDRSGGQGNLDIWVTTRSSTASSFAAPIQVQGLNTIYSDGDPWLSPDLKTIYFASDRDGTLDIFVATR